MNKVIIYLNGEERVVESVNCDSVEFQVNAIGGKVFLNPIRFILKDKDYITVKVEKQRKPTLGLVPQWVRLEEREQEIKEAIKRFDEAGEEVPENWIKELRTVQKQLAGIEVTNEQST